jgi:hypothetical protein
MGCWFIAGYLSSYYWYPFILLGREKQAELSVWLKDREKQNVTRTRFEPETSRSDISKVYFCHQNQNAKILGNFRYKLSGGTIIFDILPYLGELYHFLKFSQDPINP